MCFSSFLFRWQLFIRLAELLLLVHSFFPFSSVVFAFLEMRNMCNNTPLPVPPILTVARSEMHSREQRNVFMRRHTQRFFFRNFSSEQDCSREHDRSTCVSLRAISRASLAKTNSSFHGSRRKHMNLIKIRHRGVLGRLLWVAFTIAGERRKCSRINIESSSVSGFRAFGTCSRSFLSI